MVERLSAVPHRTVVRRPAKVRGVIFDGDDTLWLTEQLYDAARDRARHVVQEAGLDGAAWEACQRRIDVENVLKFGHAAERFPTSAVEAFEEVAKADAAIDPAASRQQVWEAAASVFQSRAPLRRGACETVRSLAQRGIRLGLLTKGDERVQHERIEQSGLRSFFDQIMIVDRKGAGSYAQMAQALGVDSDHLISVGNSINSDLVPSAAAGIFGLWLPAYVWVYEQHEPGAEGEVVRINDLDDVLDFVD